MPIGIDTFDQADNEALGEQYIACPLTTKAWYDERMLLSGVDLYGGCRRVLSRRGP